MGSHDDVTEPRPRAVERVAATVGDLDSPFYDEERDRDVWNEASAVGFQSLLWGLPLVAAALLWWRPHDVLLPVVVMLVPWVLGAGFTLVYARRQGVDPGQPEALASSPVRMALFALVVAGLASGVLRAGLALELDGALGSFTRGAVQGAAAGFVGVAVWAMIVAVRERRRRPAD